MLGGSTAPHREIGLNCRSAQVTIEDCFCRLKLDALVALSSSSFRRSTARRDSSRSDARPATRIGAAAWQPVSALVASHDEASSISFRAVGPRRRHKYLTSSQARQELARRWPGPRRMYRRLGRRVHVRAAQMNLLQIASEGLPEEAALRGGPVVYEGEERMFCPLSSSAMASQASSQPSSAAMSAARSPPTCRS